MIIQLQPECALEQENQLIHQLQKMRIATQCVKTQNTTYLVSSGKNTIDPRQIGTLPYVKDIFSISDAYQLVSSQWKIAPTEIPVSNDILVGGNEFCIMAGPCSIESEEQVETIVKHLAKNNIKVMRGGVFKPRSSPYSFQGLGIEGLKMFRSLTAQYGISIVSEVMQVEQIEQMLPYIDIFQVGTRNAQNYNLLGALGQTNKPIVLKRGYSSTLEELLLGAEYIFANGNEDIILCERGIRTFEKSYRNTLDLNAIAYLKEKTHLPVILDPSHGVGIRNLVETMSLAGIMAGADGINVEIHPEPEVALSDGQQSLYLNQASQLYKKVRKTVALRNQMATW